MFFNPLITIDYLFSPSIPSSQAKDPNFSPNSRVGPRLPTTPFSLYRESYYSSPETPSSVFSIQPSPCRSELHNQSHHRVHSTSALGDHSSWDMNPGHNLPSNPSPTTSLDPEPDMSDSESNSECPIPRFREPKTARIDAALKALKYLSKKKISVLELAGLILDGEGDFLGYRNTLLLRLGLRYSMLPPSLRKQRIKLRPQTQEIVKRSVVIQLLFLRSYSKAHLISKAVSFFMQRFTLCDRSSHVKFRLALELQPG